jgi:hypothetical protein
MIVGDILTNTDRNMASFRKFIFTPSGSRVDCNFLY